MYVLLLFFFYIRKLRVGKLLTKPYKVPMTVDRGNETSIGIRMDKHRASGFYRRKKKKKIVKK